MSNREIHPDFRYYLDQKSPDLIDLFKALRSYLLDLHPEANEILYHTHALTAVFSISEKLSDAYCMIPIYSDHFNLGFNKGTLLNDPDQLLKGTGKLIRHIPINHSSDFRNKKVSALIQSAFTFAVEDMEKPTKSHGKTISKIKT